MSLLLATTLADAQGTTFRGRVVDKTGTVVPNATVTVTSVGFSVRADSLGLFTLSGQPGAVLHVSISAAGFRDDTGSVTLSRGKTVERTFSLLAADAPEPERNPGDRTLRGRVTDVNGAPLSFANIQLNGGSRFIADDSGRFTVATAEGRIWLLVRRIGFDPAELRLPSMPDTAVHIRMTPLAHALPEQRVVGRAAIASLDLHGFYRRMKEVERGTIRGYFITPEELELRRPSHVTDAVAHVPTVRIKPIPKRLPVLRNLRIEDGRGCPMTVYLDRIRIQPTRVRGQIEDGMVNELILTSDIGGIEVYPANRAAPPEYRPIDGTCGVVLIWTR